MTSPARWKDGRPVLPPDGGTVPSPSPPPRSTPSPRPARSRPTARLIPLVVFGLVVGIRVVTAAVHTDHHAEAPETLPAVSVGSDLALGDAATVDTGDRGSGTVAVVSATPHPRGGGGAPPPVGGSYLVVRVVVTADASGPFEIRADDLEVEDPRAGTVTSDEGNAPRSGLVAAPLTDRTVAAGTTATVDLVFDVSTDATAVDLDADDALAVWDL